MVINKILFVLLKNTERFWLVHIENTYF